MQSYINYKYIHTNKIIEINISLKKKKTYLDYT